MFCTFNSSTSERILFLVSRMLIDVGSLYLDPLKKSLRRLSFLINSRSYNMTMINVNICGITTVTWEIINIRKILINIDFRSYSIKVEISRPNR